MNKSHVAQAAAGERAAREKFERIEEVQRQMEEMEQKYKSRGNS